MLKRRVMGDQPRAIQLIQRTAVACLCGIAAGLALAVPVTQAVSFDSLESGVTVQAYWIPPPAGGNQSPAVIALHGCGGLARDRRTLDYGRNRYTKIFHDAGWGTLYLDSFGPRGQGSICAQKPSERTLTEANRRLDALAALQWLARQADVDAKKLVLVGWSHGGQTVLASGDRRTESVANAPVLPAALVAFYPGCGAYDKQVGYQLVAPLLVMSGELDNWTPAPNCKKLSDRLAESGQPVRYVEYADSYHAFDSASPVTQRENVGGTKSGKAMAGGNPAAREASALEMMRFLGQSLGRVSPAP